MSNCNGKDFNRGRVSEPLSSRAPFQDRPATMKSLSTSALAILQQRTLNRIVGVTEQALARAS
jgi:hypothetical protein